MANLGDTFKDVLFAGVGALALTGEKAKELIDQMIEKGEITVDQGKELNSELKHKVAGAAENVQYDLIEARMSMMNAEQREEFLQKLHGIEEKITAREAEKAAAEAEETVEVEAVVVETEESEVAPSEGVADEGTESTEQAEQTETK